MEYILTTNGLSKQYGKFKALDSLNVNVPKGSVYGFVGKNGAGKTTLIRIVSGLQNPTRGEYTLYGRSSTEKGIERSRRKMGGSITALLNNSALTVTITLR